MEENDVIEEIFGPDPQETSSNEIVQTEDELFNEISDHANDSTENDNSSSDNTVNSDDSENNTDDSDDDSFTDKFLARIGIQNKNAIPWQDKSGAMYTRSWDSLTENEQLDILSSANTDPETDLDDKEIELINTIRNSGLDPEAYMKKFAQNVQDNYANQNKYYEIDDWSDDEIYAIDLMQRLGDQVTDEEIKEAIEKEKENMDFYQKKVNSIRQEYHNKQDQIAYDNQQKFLQIQEDNFRQLSDAVINEIQQLNTVAGMPIELDYEDQNTLASYILSRDQNGVTQYASDMKTPQAIVHNAFWALYGPQFLQEAEAESARAFRRGYEQAQRDLNSQAAVEIRSTNKPKPNRYFNT